MEIVSRAAWNARAPEKIVTVPWSKRTTVAFHYSGASKLQSVRSIQDYCMDKRGFSDIDYNFLADYKGVAYEGRGWMNRGSHILDHNTEMLGICAIGTDADITVDQLMTLRALYFQACALAGRKLAVTTHGAVTGKTDCPGSRIQHWVDQGIPDLRPASPAFPVFPGKTLMRSLKFNKNVEAWQKRMKVRGWRLKADGLFWDETEAVVRAFQKEKKLRVTGTIPKGTWDAAWTAPVTK